MADRPRDLFSTVRTEGGLLPADLLARIVADDRDLPGLDPTTYYLARHERVLDAANRAWNRLVGAWKAFREEASRLPVTDPGTRLTRERWTLVLMQELGFGRLHS